ncbi:MAG: hypothetical protein WA461_07985 [Nitrososphaeraceae archaeon]
MSLVTSDKGSGHKFLAPNPKNPNLTKQQQEDIKIFNERLRRTYEAFAKVRLSYNPSDYQTKRSIAKEKASVVLQQEYPNLTVKRLLNITRVLFPLGESLYENSDGEIDEKVRSALVYAVEVSIRRQESVDIGLYDDYMHNTIFHIGRYNRPRVRPEFDVNHNHIDSHVIGSVNRYYVPDSKKNIEDILKRFGNPIKSNPWIVAIAAPSGVEIPYVDGRKYSITNYSDWITGGIQDLINANKSGFFSNSNSNDSKETSGLNEYEKWKKAKEAALDKVILLDPQQFRDEHQKQQSNQDSTSRSEK